MSTHPNAELARKFYDHFAAGEIAPMLDMQTDDVVWILGAGAAEGVVPYLGRFSGRDGCLENMEIYEGAADAVDFELTGCYGDDDKAFVQGREKVLAKPTGKTFETEFVVVIEFRDGKVAKQTSYLDSAALTAAFSAD